MDFKKLGIVIQREYLNKVKKKSFLLTTFGTTRTAGRCTTRP